MVRSMTLGFKRSIDNHYTREHPRERISLRREGRSMFDEILTEQQELMVQTLVRDLDLKIN
jgi:hypothetical protein